MENTTAPATSSPSSAPSTSAPASASNTPASGSGKGSAHTELPGVFDSNSTKASSNVDKANSSLADNGEETKGEVETQTEAARRKYKLKIDGAEKEMEFSDDEISVRLQKAMAAEKRMQEAAETRKAFQKFVDDFKKDPFLAAKSLDDKMDLDALAEERIVRRYQEEQLKKENPNEYEKVQLQRQLEEYKSKEASFKAEQEQKAQDEYYAKVGQEMERDFMAALDKSGLPKDRRYLKMMAEVADLNLSHGIELTPAQMASEVRAQISGQHQYVTQGLKGQALIEHLGKDVVEEVLKHSIEQHKTKSSVVTKPSAKGEDSEGRTQKKVVTNRDIRNFFWERDE